ncbi:hypothetical protein D3C86_1737280 [compost metagenome]
MDQALGVDQLHGAGSTHGGLGLAARGLARGEHQHGPQALAARHDAVGHRLPEGLGAPGREQGRERLLDARGAVVPVGAQREGVGRRIQNLKSFLLAAPGGVKGVARVSERGGPASLTIIPHRRFLVAWAPLGTRRPARADVIK